MIDVKSGNDEDDELPWNGAKEKIDLYKAGMNVDSTGPLSMSATTEQLEY